MASASLITQAVDFAEFRASCLDGLKRLPVQPDPWPDLHIQEAQASVDELESEVARLKQAVEDTRTRLAETKVTRKVLPLVVNIDGAPLEIKPASGIEAVVGNIFSSICSEPLSAIACSAFGRYVALQMGDHACLCEGYVAGFVWHSARAVVPGAPVVAVRFLYPLAESVHLLAAAADVCIAWDALRDELLLRVQAASGQIVAVDTVLDQQSHSSDNFLLLATDRCRLEVYNLADADGPQLLRMFSVGTASSSLVGAALSCDGLLASALVIEHGGAGGDTKRVAVHAFEVDGEADSAAEGVKVDDCPVLSAWLRMEPDPKKLAFCPCLDSYLIAVGVAGGLVQVIDAEFRDPIAAVADTSMQTLSPGQPVAPTQHQPSDCSMTLAWRLRQTADRLLVVGGWQDAVLLYRYFDALLELVCRVGIPQICAPLRGLAFAQETGELFAVYDRHWQFWLVEDNGPQGEPAAATSDGGELHGASRDAGGSASGPKDDVLTRLEMETEQEDEEVMFTDSIGADLLEAEDQPEEPVSLFGAPPGDSEDESNFDEGEGSEG
mmetsp:Transcript_75959/g.210921  ORF Transcript_75959/g.210921 Transcript_75959/m.210921 type:complete len:552 (-) Transcript_75959:108-1763(-)